MRPVSFYKREKIFNSDPESLIRVYSRQHIDSLSVANKVGYFTGEHKFQDGDGWWESQYNWMRNQMSYHIPNFSGDLPIWAYISRPLHKGWWKLRPEMIQITALIPRKRILLSDYELWHLPLNNGPICETEQEYDEWYDNKKENPETTWYKCLNVLRDDKTKNWLGISDRIQACIDRIYISEIVNVKYPK